MIKTIDKTAFFCYIFYAYWRSLMITWIQTGVSTPVTEAAKRLVEEAARAAFSFSGKNQNLDIMVDEKIILVTNRGNGDHSSLYYGQDVAVHLVDINGVETLDVIAQ